MKGFPGIHCWAISALWGHAGPYCVAENAAAKRAFFTGFANLKFPTGGSAKGIPKNVLKLYVVVLNVAVFTVPMKFPAAECTETVAASQKIIPDRCTIREISATPTMLHRRLYPP